MFNHPRLIHFTICALLAVLCLVGKDYLSVEWGAVCGGFALVFAGTGFLFLFLWMGHNWVMYQTMVINAQNDTWEVRLTRNIAGMSKDQIDAWRDNVPILSLVAGEPWPIRTVTLGGEQILYSFARRFVFEDGTETNLAALGQYSEGSKERKWATVLTGYLLGNGYARKVGGPYPPQWINRKQGIKSLGLED